jgi:hypothetical protein
VKESAFPLMEKTLNDVGRLLVFWANKLVPPTHQRVRAMGADPEADVTAFPNLSGETPSRDKLYERNRAE